MFFSQFLSCNYYVVTDRILRFVTSSILFYLNVKSRLLGVEGNEIGFKGMSFMFFATGRVKKNAFDASFKFSTSVILIRES